MQPETPRSHTANGTGPFLWRYIRVLDALAEAHRPLTAAELAQQVGLPISSTYRLLAQLRAVKLVTYVEPGNRFWLGLKCLEYGGAVSENLNVREVALPVMRELSAKCRETVHLTVRDGDEGVFAEKVEAMRGPIRWHTEVGRRVPLHAGASMKVQLAFLPATERAALLRGKRLVPMASGTVTDPRGLEIELTAIRARGWASSFEELNEGAAGVSAPVFDHSGAVVAGLTITGPRGRLEGRVDEFAALVVEAASTVSAELGYTASTNQALGRQHEKTKRSLQ